MQAGLKISLASLPLAIRADIYNTVKYEVGFIKELVNQINSEIRVDDTSATIYRTISKKHAQPTGRRFNDEALSRLAQIQIAKFFEAIAPNNYEAKQWGSLIRVPQSDGIFRWLCELHR